MRPNELRLVVAILLGGCSISFSQVQDTIPPPPMSPAMETETKTVDFTGLYIAWAGNFLPQTIFFNPGDDKLSSNYNGILSEMAARLVQNPDIECSLRGYYSHDIDGIASPIDGEDLAYRRAQAVREALILSESQLELKLETTSSGYELTEPFSSEPSFYDSRVEIVPKISGWNPKVIVATSSQPYWRRGFRIISKQQSDFLRNILSRNPDLDLLFSSGELGVSAKEAAKRIDVVVARFEKDMKWKDNRQFVATYGGISKPHEMTIDLWPSFFGPEPLNGSLLWTEPAEPAIDPIRFEPSTDSASTAYAFRVDRDMQSSRAPVAWDRRKPPKLVKFKPLEDTPLILPSDLEFSLITWGHDRSVERSEWIPIECDFDSNYSEMASVPAVPFVMNSVEPLCHWESALSPIVSRIEYFIKKGGTLHIQITGHAVEVEENADSLSIERANHLWERLSCSLMAAFNRETLDDLGKYLSEKNVGVEVGGEVHTTDSAASILPWATGHILDLPPEHAIPWGAMTTVKWEYHSDE